MVVNNLDIVVSAPLCIPVLQHYNYNIYYNSVLNLNGGNGGLKRLESIKVRNVLNILSRLKRLTFLAVQFRRFSCL